ncbi:MAG: hypothetical protein Q7T56_18150 [Nocardioidaceae bacterium]|nr:hypothetical protein [Nocardioidaceae bacterium]
MDTQDTQDSRDEHDGARADFERSSGHLDDTVRRLVVELGDRFTTTEITTTVRQCALDLSSVPPADRPELTERCARERLRQAFDDGS